MDYKEILDFESSKLLGLFNLLRVADSNSSLEQLSSQLKINAKTILRTMKKMTRLFSYYHLDEHITICDRSRKSFYLKRDNDLYLELFLVRYLNDLPEVAFLKVIIEEQVFLPKQLAERLSISESSIRKRVKKVKEWLKKYEISLKRGTYELVGEEEQIRGLILQFYWFAYQGTENRFLSAEKTNSHRLADRIIHFFKMQINDLQKESLVRLIQIAFWRYTKGNIVIIKPTWAQYTENSAMFPKFVAFIKESSLNIVFEEIVYLYLIIQAHFIPYFGSGVQAYFINEHYSKKTECFSIALSATDKFKQIFWNKKITHSKESIIAFLGFHLYYELLSGFVFEKNQSISILRESYPNFMERLEQGLTELNQEHLHYQRIPGHTLMYRYFMILSSLISPVYNEKRVFICLMTDLPLEKELDLGKRLMDFFRNKFNLAVIYARTSTSILYADIMLTNVIYQATSHKYVQDTLLIEQDFSDELFFKIEKLIKKVRN